MTMQFNLFDEVESTPILTEDGKASLWPKFFNEKKISFDKLNSEIPWQSGKIKIYGREVLIPRLQCWLNDSQQTYTYSHTTLNPIPFGPIVGEIKNFIENRTGEVFNSCLANFYRDGNDYCSWHSDDEPELGQNPIIASASFGGERMIHFRHRYKKGIETIKIALPNNSLLLMDGPIQHRWRHQLAKTAREVSPRINLTFRLVL